MPKPRAGTRYSTGCSATAGRTAMPQRTFWLRTPLPVAWALQIGAGRPLKEVGIFGGARSAQTRLNREILTVFNDLTLNSLLLKFSHLNSDFNFSYLCQLLGQLHCVGAERTSSCHLTVPNRLYLAAASVLPMGYI